MLKNVTHRMLTEAGFTVQSGYFTFLDEATKLQVTDNALTEMFKLITDKYNSLDFSEIEKSAGDYTKFKYRSLIDENATTLYNIYSGSDDPGAAKYLKVIQSIRAIQSYLARRDDEISFLYKKGNGLVQVLYTSMVASMLYSLTALVNNTIRFVTTEQDTDMVVLFDEIPNSIRQVHIRNVMAVADDLDEIDKVIMNLYNTAKNGANTKVVSESVVDTLAIGTLVVAGIIYMIPKIVALIREIIYSIYYSRVKWSEALDVQIQLIRTNIESLEAGRGNKKIIARQKKIADKLEKLKNRIAVKMDAADSLSKVQQKRENVNLKIDASSPLASDNTVGLML